MELDGDHQGQKDTTFADAKAALFLSIEWDNENNNWLVKPRGEPCSTSGNSCINPSQVVDDIERVIAADRAEG